MVLLLFVYLIVVDKGHLTPLVLSNVILSLFHSAQILFHCSGRGLPLVVPFHRSEYIGHRYMGIDGIQLFIGRVRTSTTLVYHLVCLLVFVVPKCKLLVLLVLIIIVH